MKTARAIIKVLEGRKGFGDWWDNIDVNCRTSILMDIEAVVILHRPGHKAPAISCGKCGGYVAGHATGAGDICTCKSQSKVAACGCPEGQICSECAEFRDNRAEPRADDLQEGFTPQ